MDFISILIFLVVFVIVFNHFGIQFINYFKINDLLLESEDSLNTEKQKGVKKLCLINIVLYCVTCFLLSTIYYLLTKKIELFVGGVSVLALFLMYLIYLKAGRSSGVRQINTYAVYNKVNFVWHIIVAFVPIVFVFTALNC